MLLNTNALRRELGTGGDAMVVARLDALPEAQEIAGHMVKARYTPMQTMVDAIDDPAGEHYETIREAKGIDGMPVVVADLHSSLPAIIAGIRRQRRGARIAYVHTDAASLPAAYSRSAARLREADLLAAVISSGQSFGGDLEAVTVHSALLGAKHVVGADVAIVIQGPGNLGTGTGWGFSGVQAAEAIHAASVLGGRPVATLRVSGADERSRHRGLSHHSSTTYGRALLSPVHLPVVPRNDSRYNAFHESVRKQVKSTILKPAKKRGRAAPSHRGGREGPAGRARGDAGADDHDGTHPRRGSRTVPVRGARGALRRDAHAAVLSSAPPQRTRPQQF